jgi:hypothetical protein
MPRLPACDKHITICRGYIGMLLIDDAAASFESFDKPMGTRQSPLITESQCQVVYRGKHIRMLLAVDAAADFEKVFLKPTGTRQIAFIIESREQAVHRVKRLRMFRAEDAAADFENVSRYPKQKRDTESAYIGGYRGHRFVRLTSPATDPASESTVASASMT